MPWDRRVQSVNFPGMVKSQSLLGIHHNAWHVPPSIIMAKQKADVQGPVRRFPVDEKSMTGTQGNSWCHLFIFRNMHKVLFLWKALTYNTQAFAEIPNLALHPGPQNERFCASWPGSHTTAPAYSLWLLKHTALLQAPTPEFIPRERH